MLMTREADYAIRILRALADGKLRSIEEICRMEATPKQFAYKIIKKLEKAGFLEILRGSGGGCRLTVDLSTVSLLSLVRVMGTDNIVSDCLASGYYCTRRDVCDDSCQVQIGLNKVQKAIELELEMHTLLALISPQMN